jgi:hypothetical protein
MRDSLKKVQADALGLGLYVEYYNPGDNPQFKVATVPGDYFGLRSNNVVFRASKLSTVRQFLNRYVKGK